MKVYPFEIPKPVKDSIIVQIDKCEAFFDRLHQHKEMQISYVVAGQGKLIISNSVYRFAPGDIFVISGNTPHLFQSTEQPVQSHMISVFLTRENFGDGFQKIHELEKLLGFLEASKNSFKLLSEVEAVQKLLTQMETTVGLEKFVCFLKLINKIADAKKFGLTNDFQPKKISIEEGKRMQTVFNYVINNFQKEIKLDTVSELVYMTPNSFCRFFKQRTNKTFVEFVIELRIEHACQLLADGQESSIAEIAYQSGFTSISNFNRKFKKLKNATPKEYQKNIKVAISLEYI